MFTKGNILNGEGIIHHIVYLAKIDDYNFMACMLTHSTEEKYPNNISLKPEHIEIYDENKNEYEFRYDRTYFVKMKLIKKTEWGPYRKVGKLTNDGVAFLEKHLKELEPTEWRKYMAKAS